MLKRSLQAEITLCLGYNSGDQFDGAVVIFAGQDDPYPAYLDTGGARLQRHIDRAQVLLNGFHRASSRKVPHFLGVSGDFAFPNLRVGPARRPSFGDAVASEPVYGIY